MTNNYQAIILAAGRGSRMGKATEHSHKCLTILEDKTLLAWQLEALKSSGIKDVTVVRGYKSEMLTGDFNTAENPRWAETNMVATLFCAPRFKQDTIVSYSDIVYSSDHVKDLIEKEGDIVITADENWLSLWSSRFDNPLEDAETFQADRDVLISIGEKNNTFENIEAQYMGLSKFSPKGWEIAKALYDSLTKERQDKLDMTSLLSLLLKKTKIKVCFISGSWCEVDSYSDVVLYENLLNVEGWSHDWRK
jgi:L-glutamine-phosphate cytidylyltransferase